MFTWDFSLQCSIRIKFSLYKVRTSFKKVWEVFYGGSKLHFFYTIFFLVIIVKGCLSETPFFTLLAVYLFLGSALFPQLTIYTGWCL